MNEQEEPAQGTVFSYWHAIVSRDSYHITEIRGTYYRNCSWEEGPWAGYLDSTYGAPFSHEWATEKREDGKQEWSPQGRAIGPSWPASVLFSKDRFSTRKSALEEEKTQ